MMKFLQIIGLKLNKGLREKHGSLRQATNLFDHTKGDDSSLLQIIIEKNDTGNENLIILVEM